MNYFLATENQESSQNNKNYEIEKKECRYCLSEGALNEFITPCLCEGTMKYVHQQCLEDWIKNCNKPIQESIKGGHKFFSIICEICKFQMRYTKTYKNNFFVSITKLLRSIFSNIKSTFLLGIHSVVIYFIFRRFSMIMNDIPKLFAKRARPSFWMNLFHNFTVCFSIIMAIDDIIRYYRNMYVQKRKCVVKFLSVSD